MSKILNAVDNTPSEVMRGLTLMIGGAFLVPVMDTVAKYLGEIAGLPSGQVALARFSFQTILTLPFLVAFDGWRALKIERPLLNLFRGALTGLASLMFFTALKFMPLADAISVFFVEPFILTILSAIVLRETVGWRRRIAVAVGFVGAVIVIRPSFAVFGLVSVLPLVTAALFASYLLLNRQLARTGTALSLLFWAGIGGTGVVLAAMAVGSVLAMPELAFEAPESALVWFLLVTTGALALIGHLLITMAFQRAPASLLAPFQYMEIVSATALGYWVFGDFPDALKWLGIAIIVVSGIYVFWREQVTARRTLPPREPSRP